MEAWRAVTLTMEAIYFVLLLVKHTFYYRHFSWQNLSIFSTPHCMQENIRQTIYCIVKVTYGHRSLLYVSQGQNRCIELKRVTEEKENT